MKPGAQWTRARDVLIRDLRDLSPAAAVRALHQLREDRRRLRQREAARAEREVRNGAA